MEAPGLDMDSGEKALAEVSAHERECGLRYEAIERRMNTLERIVWGLYPFLLITIVIAEWLRN